MLGGVNLPPFSVFPVVAWKGDVPKWVLLPHDVCKKVLCYYWQEPAHEQRQQDQVPVPG